MSKRIYYNGTVLTSDEKHPFAYAVLTENGRISEVIYESIPGIEEHFPDAERFDLKGNTLIPGFVDAHSHFLSTPRELRQLNAAASPLGESDSVEELVASLKRQLSTGRFDSVPYLYARGYDESVYPDHRLPTRLDLDKVTDKPLAVTHISGHNTVFNSAALALAGITDDYQPGEDGSAGRLADGSLSGVFYENAVRDVFPKREENAEQTIREGLDEALLRYISEGVTTAQDGATDKESYRIARALADEGKFPIEVVSYLSGDAAELLDIDGTKKYSGNYRAQGYKLFLDGSPQAKTAWLSKPYHHTLKGQDDSYRGYGIYTDEQLLSLIGRALKSGWQINVHTNGDEAIEQLIRVYSKAAESVPDAAKTRPVSIHCQTVRSDQLDRIKEAGILVSFFVDHVYYWGDYHLSEILGADRASRISPLGEALKKGIRFTTHQDTPVTRQSPLFAIHNAVNRVTRSGQVLGEQYRISVLDALRAVTINSAYQLFEENTKGSIEPGKQADFVIIDRDITSIPASQIKDTLVLKTVKRDKVIFSRKQVR
ncbi:MAG: amidohydrolase [Ruminococcus sp.]|nr:amidohydrolase [Ruminococcus sp.]